MGGGVEGERGRGGKTYGMVVDSMYKTGGGRNRRSCLMLQSALSMTAARLGEDLEGSPLVRSRMLLAAADLAR